MSRPATDERIALLRRIIAVHDELASLRARAAARLRIAPGH